ncbi:hypothetical protein B0T14DRAFT_520393 [Immersiella caudata]|uniref:Uncharacterized protein n=1 Tax=Immersiella caudata TaxID=314043 RepID=A0AA39WR05_9PEZI|nr:hypothetical protein B0T14DRAFT_520393 [Immersiella caudata]
MVKISSRITALATFALLTSTSLCTTTTPGGITIASQTPTTPASTTCPPTTSSRYVYRPQDTCFTCSCGTPTSRPPCTTPTPVTNTVTTSLPYISDCIVYHGCQTSCNCPMSFCTWETKATPSSA